MSNSDNNLDNIRHSCAHLLAAAVMELWPDTKRTIGPAIDNGFYCDFEFKNPVTEEDFPKIEERMKQILKTWNGFEKHELTAEEAKKEYPDNAYKIELIEEFTQDGQKVTFYKSGDYWDLCAGGHTGDPQAEIKAFKLLSVAGAYWRGSEKNKMLTRIYGTVFPTQKELDDYLLMQEEAKKRDHRKLGRELDLFTFSDLVGKGLPLFTPKGAMLRELLNDFSQELRIKQGYQRVWTPHITKTELYKTSGHWDKFGDELFLVKSQETEDQLVMKPMNCPHHQQIYASRPRSYKEFPIKYMETTTIYRDEKAGELIGLSRVRAVTQDDSHTFCTLDQIKEVYQMLIQVTKEFYGALGMKFKARLSFRDPVDDKKYLGEKDQWEKAQKIILEVAKENELDYFVAEGEAAFYGPKIDFMVMDALGREWQLATPQLDFVQPKRFGLTYVDEKGSDQTPVMIHFALMGSIERFLSVYIEHTGGAFPTWLSPVQVMVIPISEKHLDYAQKVLEQLLNSNVRVEIDSRNESMQAKIRDAQMQKIPYMLVVGNREASENTVAVRSRLDGKQEVLKIEEFINQITQTIESKL